MTINAFTPTARRLRRAAGLACCAAAFLGMNGAADAQEPEPLAILSPIEFDFCDAGVCTIGFTGLSECEYTIWGSGDLENWDALGFFVETSPGQFEFVDSGSADQSKRYYQIEFHFDPPEQVELPPEYEQLRLELGDEGFGQWLEQNKQETGNHQGVPEGVVNGMSPEEQQLFDDIEQLLEDFLNELNGPVEPPLVLPAYIETFEIMGPDAFVDALNQNFINLGNYQGVCGTSLIEMGELYPELYQGFLDIEQQLQDYFEGLLILPDPPQVELPPQLEQLRQELGDEAFAEWLQNNMQQWGNLQGIAENAVQEMQANFPEQYQEFLEREQLLQQWLEAQGG